MSLSAMANVSCSIFQADQRPELAFKMAFGQHQHHDERNGSEPQSQE